MSVARLGDLVPRVPLGCYSRNRTQTGGPGGARQRQAQLGASRVLCALQAAAIACMCVIILIRGRQEEPQSPYGNFSQHSRYLEADELNQDAMIQRSVDD